MFTMKIYNKFKKIICCTLLLIVLSIACSGCHFNVTTENSSSSQSSSSKGSSSSTGNFALKYKDQEMDFDEYLYIVVLRILSLVDLAKTQNASLAQVVSSENVDGQPAAEYIKQASIQKSTEYLMAREKFQQMGKELDDESKKYAQDFASNPKNIEYAKTLGVSQNGVKIHGEDYMKLIYLKKSNTYLGNNPKDGELIVNDEVVDGIDLVDLAKRVDECLQNGARLIE